MNDFFLLFDKVIFPPESTSNLSVWFTKTKKLLLIDGTHLWLLLLLLCRADEVLFHCFFCVFNLDICINLKSFTINVLLFETNELILSIGNREMYFVFTVND